MSQDLGIGRSRPLSFFCLCPGKNAENVHRAQRLAPCCRNVSALLCGMTQRRATAWSRPAYGELDGAAIGAMSTSRSLELKSATPR